MSFARFLALALSLVALVFAGVSPLQQSVVTSYQPPQNAITAISTLSTVIRLQQPAGYYPLDERNTTILTHPSHVTVVPTPEAATPLATTLARRNRQRQPVSRVPADVVTDEVHHFDEVAVARADVILDDVEGMAGESNIGALQHRIDEANSQAKAILAHARKLRDTVSRYGEKVMEKLMYPPPHRVKRSEVPELTE